MEAYKNILCGTDFSKQSEPAVERAVELAKRFGAKLTLLHVVEYFPEDRSNEMIAPEDVDPKAYREEQSDKLLTELVQKFDCKDARHEVVFSTHSAGREIVRYAGEQQVDLVIVGSHGYHGITVILGSTAITVIHSAPCDVLAIRSSK